MTLFKGTFNWYCEVHILYTRAKNKYKAFNNFIVQLSKILKRNRSTVYIYFIDGKKDNWDIEKENQNGFRCWSNTEGDY